MGVPGAVAHRKADEAARQHLGDKPSLDGVADLSTAGEVAECPEVPIGETDVRLMERQAVVMVLRSPHRGHTMGTFRPRLQGISYDHRAEHRATNYLCNSLLRVAMQSDGIAGDCIES